MSRDTAPVLQIPGNLSASAFGSISEAARRSHIPVFAFQKSQAIGGAVVVVGPHYPDTGAPPPHLAGGVIPGGDTGKNPLEGFWKNTRIGNPQDPPPPNNSLPPAPR